MKSLAIGLASGLGNAVFMLPTIKALKLMGNSVTLYVETDFPTVDLWRRCTYADEVLEAPASLNGHSPMCGNYRPSSWRSLAQMPRFPIAYPYRQSEWLSNFRLAQSLGWKKEPPGVSDWCRDLDRTPRWDVGIVPGSKGGVWLRKRWPGLADIAAHLISQGYKTAVFGQEDDGVGTVPGERVDTRQIEGLPDALAGCRLIIGTDSGPVHLASSLGIPVVIIYTATSEIKGDPVGTPNRKVLRGLPCRPCQTTPGWQTCRNWRCREIDPGLVLAAAQEFLE